MNDAAQSAESVESVESAESPSGGTRSFKRGMSWRVTVWLVAMWLVLFRDVSLVTIVGGIAVAVGIQLLFPMPHLGVFRRLRIGALIVLVVRFVVDIFSSAVRVALIVVRNAHVESYVVSVPMRIQSQLYTTLVGDMCSLTPGTLVIGARMLPATVELHVFDSRSFGMRQKVIDDTQALEARIVRAIGSAEEVALIERAEAAKKRRLDMAGKSMSRKGRP